MVKLFSTPILPSSSEEHRLALDQLRGVTNTVPSGCFRCGSQRASHTHIWQ